MQYIHPPSLSLSLSSYYSYFLCQRHQFLAFSDTILTSSSPSLIPSLSPHSLIPSIPHSLSLSLNIYIHTQKIQIITLADSYNVCVQHTKHPHDQTASLLNSDCHYFTHTFLLTFFVTSIYTLCVYKLNLFISAFIE